MFAKKNNAQIVVCMLSNYLMNNKRYYNRLVKFCLENGINSQFMITNAKKAMNPRGYDTGCLLQIINKVGIVPYRLEHIPYMDTLVKNQKIKVPRVQVIGVDVCHLPGRKSMVAISSTTNASMTSFYNNFEIVGKKS